jgi:hypothetical protein
LNQHFNRDGEIVATAKAIGRQLSKNDNDWHDLAALLTAPPVMYQPEPDPHCGCVTSYREAVNWIIANDNGRLSEKKYRFVHDMQRNLARWGHPTQKQVDWIDSILDRLGGFWA